MILVLCIASGMLLRLAGGRNLADLSRAGLKGETVLLILLAAQALPPVLGVTGGAARIAYWVWVATFPCLVWIAWLNRRSPGVLMLGLGLLLNLTVILANGGMPVFALAIAAIKPGTVGPVIAATDFVHVAGTTATRLPWLSDIIPIAGPAWLRSIASPGDCLLFAGVAAFLAASAADSPPRRSAE